ncbi:MAG TPA: urea ABC transporter permease subunit UrtB, partial [Burkholderiaceae bacterium]
MRAPLSTLPGRLARRVCIAALFACSLAAQALTPAQVRGIASGDTDARIAALNQAVAQGDPSLAAFVQAMLDDAVKLSGDQVLVVRDDRAIDAASLAPVALPASTDDVINNNRMRGALEAAMSGLKLFSADPAVRDAAVGDLLKQSLDETQLPLIEKAYAAETVPAIKTRLDRMRSTILIASSDQAKRLAAAHVLAASGQASVRGLLLDRLA